MRIFKDDDTLTLGPWRAQAFPLIRDLIVNRSAFDQIIQAGGFISAPTGNAPDANAIMVAKEAADTAFDAAACIGCGACVAACPNAAAMLFTSAKLTDLNALHKVSLSATIEPSTWWLRWQPKPLAAARTMASVKRYAPKKYRLSSSEG